MLWQRVAAAAVFTPPMVLFVYWGGLSLTIACAVLSALMLWETLRMLLGSDDGFGAMVGYAAGAAVLAHTLGYWPPAADGLLAPLGVVLVYVALLGRPEPIEAASRRAAFIVFAALYACALLPVLVHLRGFGPYFGMCALLCTWAADTGAYFSGRAFGRHKLYPKISPKKTIEGAVGGVVSAGLASVGLRWAFEAQIGIGHAVALGVLAGVFGIVGDLAESMLKRSVGAKDSSALIPGHGGVLDRFDAVMFVAPAMFAYVRLVQP